MATENLSIPEEHLADVIRVIRAGLTKLRKGVSADVRRELAKWCDDEEEYLNQLGEE